jgi:hypothetical protein
MKTKYRVESWDKLWKGKQILEENLVKIPIKPEM